MRLTILTLTMGAAIALLAVSRTTHTTTSQTIDHYANEEWMTLRGSIAAEPDRRPMQTKYTITVEEIHTRSEGIIPVIGRILATDRRTWPEYHYGDTVIVRGTLERPGQIETFSYDNYLSRFGIYSVMYSASFEKTGGFGDPQHVAGNTAGLQTILHHLFNLKERFEAQTNRLYAEPYASFMAGLLTGSRKGIPERLLEEFNITGLTHIIAISGYNITIIISIISGFLFWLPLKWRFVPAVFAISAFTIFVGASAAVVRAAIMGILGLLALQAGRQYDVRLGILWTLFFMLIWNPKYLWYDAGFQLSFLAVLGLVELSPLMDRWFARVPTLLGIREGLQMTMAAQISAVPLIVLLFGRLSLIAPIANILVAPAIPLAMLFGFLGTVLSWIYFPLGQLVAYLGWGCLEWVILVAHALANIPYASVDTPKMSLVLFGMYYVGIGLWLLNVNRRREN